MMQTNGLYYYLYCHFVAGLYMGSVYWSFVGSPMGKKKLARTGKKKDCEIIWNVEKAWRPPMRKGTHHKNMSRVGK